MKKLITVAILVVVAMACKDKKQAVIADRDEFSMVKEDPPQKTKEEIKKKESSSKLPTSYDFEYKLVVVAEANNEKIDMTFLVKPGASYYGTKLTLSKKNASKKTMTVMDVGRNKILSFRDGKGGKFLRIKSMPEVKDEAAQQITIERTNTKKILGYNCQGYIINTDDGTSTVYLTQDAGFAFDKGFSAYSKLSLNGKGIDTDIVEELENGLLLELQYIGNGNNAAIMRVKEIAKMPYSVDLSEYKIIGS